MTMMQKKSYEGQEINGYLIIEEIQQQFPESFSPQRKHQSRFFLVEDTVTGVQLERTLGNIRSGRLKTVGELQRFNDLSGISVGCYDILRLAEGAELPAKLRGRRIYWICLDKRTGVEQEVPAITLQNMISTRKRKQDDKED